MTQKGENINPENTSDAHSKPASDRKQKDYFSFRMFMLFPFILFLFAFGVDKLFWIGDHPSYFLRTASFVNYDHKKTLIDQLEQYLQKKDRKKVMVMFGNSRTTAFDLEYLKAKYPEWILYNFSVPGGTSDFYYYYLTQFQKRGIKPDYIYFALTPQGFNTIPKIDLDEVMLHGLPVHFVLKNFYHYDSGDLSNYIAKKMFRNYMNKPRFNIIMRRIRNDGLQAKQYREFVEHASAKLEKNYGSVPDSTGKIPMQENNQKLMEQGRAMFQAYLNPFVMDEGQMYFTDQTLQITQDMGIPAALLWPRVGSEARKLMKEQPVILPEQPDKSEKTTILNLWKPRIQRIAEKHSESFLDMNYEDSIQCDVFYDASHMASVCFNEFTDYLMDHIHKEKEQ